MNSFTRPFDWQIRLIQLLAIPGLLLAFYLWLYHNGQIATICTASGWEDCGKVSGPDAPYSSIGPVPVALIGFIGYALIFVVTWAKDWVTILEDNLSEIIIGLTGLAFLFSLGLTGLELFIIHAFCRYCIVSAAIITLMFILALSTLPQVSEDKTTPNTA